MMKTQRILTGIFIFSLFFCNINAQTQDWRTDKRINIVFGLTQPLLVKGFNLEGNYIRNRFIFDYSHGASLDFSGPSLTPELKDQNLVVHIPWTTGFGIGYRVKEWVNVRLEPKWHRFEFYYDGDAQQSQNRITTYTTSTLGIGVYGHYQPFRKSQSFAKGLMLAPSVRFWPTISSTADGESFTYQNRTTGRQEQIKVLDPGIGFTPFIFNVSIGYTFGLTGGKQ